MTTLRTFNKRRRRIEARKSIFESMVVKNGHQYRTYRRPSRRPEPETPCRECRKRWGVRWIEKNGLCPLCY